MIKIITVILILILLPSMSYASINGTEVYKVMTDLQGNGDGVYLLFNFTYHYLMLYVVAPVAAFKVILLIIEKGSDHE